MDAVLVGEAVLVEVIEEAAAEAWRADAEYRRVVGVDKGGHGVEHVVADVCRLVDDEDAVCADGEAAKVVALLGTHERYGRAVYEREVEVAAVALGDEGLEAAHDVFVQRLGLAERRGDEAAFLMRRRQRGEGEDVLAHHRLALLPHALDEVHRPLPMLGEAVMHRTLVRLGGVEGDVYGGRGGHFLTDWRSIFGAQLFHDT